jgi:hypothetical protein
MTESSKWREWQEHDARRRASLLVQDAVTRWRYDREPFYGLHHLAGMCGGAALEQVALHEELARIANGSI